MEDTQIIDLYWQRSESAISETHRKYGALCRRIAMNVLASPEDAEESVSDTYLAAWNALPPQRPSLLGAFLGKITRRIAIDRWRAASAEKRGGGQVPLCLEELTDCAWAGPSIEDRIISGEAYAALNRFLTQLPSPERTVFLRRYFFFDSISDIAGRYGYSESKVVSMLHRTRQKLRTNLSKEGYL